MTRIRDWLLAALGVVVLSFDGWGCASGEALPELDLEPPAPPVVAEPTPSPTPRPPPPTLWFDKSSPFYEAQMAWGLAAYSEPKLVVEYANLVNRDCNIPAGMTAFGCNTKDGSTIFIQPLDEKDTRALLLHEMGHFLVAPRHLDTDGPVDGCAAPDQDNNDSIYVMCSHGPLDLYTPTDRDITWALNNISYDL